jgi:hypothetical protein
VSSGINSVEIILDPGNKGWILEKMSEKISNELNQLNCRTVVQSEPKFDTDVTFWIQYTDKTLKNNINNTTTNIRSALVTHVDESYKLFQVKNLYKFGITPIFMSKEHAQVVAKMLNQPNDFLNVHIGSDIAQVKKSFHVGIVSKCHPDGRKNEKWLIDFAKDGLLENVELTIIGVGWGPTVNHLHSRITKINLYDGIENEYPPYDEIIKMQKSFDLFFYFGFDEGSLGALDSYLLGKDLLISKQGFHTEFEIEDSSFFENFFEAKAKFQIKKDVHFNSFPDTNLWTWQNTALQLLEHWVELKSSKNNGSLNPVNNTSTFYILPKYLNLLPTSLYRLFFVRVPQKILKFFTKE